MKIQWAGFLFCLVFLAVNAQAETATDIVRKSDEKMRGISGYVEMTMQIVRVPTDCL